MARLISAVAGELNHIGRAGENLYTTISFDVSDWKAPEESFTGVFSLYVQQTGIGYYSQPIIQPNDPEVGNGNTVLWNVTNINTSIIGLGKCELIYSENTDILKPVLTGTWTQEPTPEGTILPVFSVDGIGIVATQPQPNQNFATDLANRNYIYQDKYLTWNKYYVDDISSQVRRFLLIDTEDSDMRKKMYQNIIIKSVIYDIIVTKAIDYNEKGYISDFPSGATNVEDICSYTLHNEGTVSIYPTQGYDAMRAVSLEVPSLSDVSGDISSKFDTNNTEVIPVSANMGMIVAAATDSGWVEEDDNLKIPIILIPSNTITPGQLDIEITGNKYLYGNQTIKGDSNLLPANIVEGVTIFGVTGTAETGGGGVTPSGTLSINANSTYDVTNYAAVEVNVPSGFTMTESLDSYGGTVLNITGGAVETTSLNVTQNGTYTATSGTAYDVVEVNVSGGMGNIEGNKIVTISNDSVEITPSTGYDAMAKVTATVAAGTEGTPTTVRGTVSNHSVTITPRVVNTAGYISGGTKNGTSETVRASDLVSGTKSITSNGSNIDVTNYAAVNVNVSGGSTPIISTKTGNNWGTASSFSITLSAIPQVVMFQGHWSNNESIGEDSCESGWIRFNSNGTINSSYGVCCEGIPSEGAASSSTTSISASINNLTLTITPSTPIGAYRILAVGANIS